MVLVAETVVKGVCWWCDGCESVMLVAMIWVMAVCSWWQSRGSRIVVVVLGWWYDGDSDSGDGSA